MLIHPWDAALDADEWRAWLRRTERFGLLSVNNRDPKLAPIVVPTHFTLAGEKLLVHFARPNPVWPHIEASSEVRLVVVGDYAFIPGYWRAGLEGPEEEGVPTTYYSTVQFVCRPTVVDDPSKKAEILDAQLEDFQPEGRHAVMSIDHEPYGRMLAGIRGLSMDVLRAEAKFKYDDQKPVEHRERVNVQLQRRSRGLDTKAAAEQRRRMATLGEWKAGD